VEFLGERNGGIDGGVVGGTLEEQLIGAQPQGGADGGFQRVDGLAQARGDDGVERAAPAENAGEQVKGEGAVAGCEGGPIGVPALGEERGVFEGGPVFQESEYYVA